MLLSRRRPLQEELLDLECDLRPVRLPKRQASRNKTQSTPLFVGIDSRPVLCLCLADIDGRCIERILEMDRIVLLDHLNAGAAVLGYLVDIGTFHEAHADIGIAQAVSRARLAVSVIFNPARSSRLLNSLT